MSTLSLTSDEAEKIAEARRLLDEVNAGLIERGSPVSFAVTTARNALLADYDGVILVSGGRREIAEA